MSLFEIGISGSAVILESITPSMVPAYLQDSEFGASLNYDDDEEFSVPIGVTKQTPEVESVEDLSHLLATVRFWGLCEHPYSAELQQVGIISEALRVNTRTEQIEIAMKSGYLVLVKYLHSKGIHFSEQAVQLAIYNGHADCLEYALQSDIGLSGAACTAAIHSTDTACIRVVLKYCPDTTNKTSEAIFIFPPPRERYTVLDAAACIGDIAYIEDARKRGVCLHGVTTAAAASNGQLDCLKYLRANDCPWGYPVVEEAAKNKHFDCVAYALAHGAEVYEWAAVNSVLEAGELRCLQLLPGSCFQNKPSPFCTVAAQHGHLDCLTWLHEQRPCEWDTTVTTAAAEAGHYDCLWYAIQHGCPVAKHLSSILANNGGEALLLQFAHHSTPDHALQLAVCAATNGYMKCLTYVVEQGCRKLTIVCNAAAAHSKLACLQYLCEQGFRYSAHTMHFAARNGHNACVEYLLQQGCAVDVPTCERLAAAGQLYLLQRALMRFHSSNISGNKCITTNRVSLSSKDCANIMQAAARHGQLACLQYLHEQLGFPVMDKVVSAAAVRKGQWECVRYLAQQQGCAVAKKALKRQAGRATA